MKLLQIKSGTGMIQERFALETIVAVSGDFTAVADDHTHYTVTTTGAPITGVNGDLPQATTARIGLTLTFKRRGNRRLNLIPFSGDNVDGDASGVRVIADKAVITLRVVAVNQWEIS